MKYKKLINKVKNHKTLYDNFSFSTYNKTILVDEPYGLRLLFLGLFLYSWRDYHLIIHNLNTWLDLPQHRTGKGLKFLLKRYLRKFILLRSKAVIVVALPLKRYFIKHSSKEVHYVPFVNVNKFVKPKTLLGKNIVVIPGTVSRLKRYDRIIAKLNDLQSDEIHFLGKVDSNSLDIPETLRLRISPELRDKLHFYNNRIPEKQFSDLIEKSNVILVDFNESIITKEEYIEYFGISKESGTFWLAALYGKKLFAPIFRDDILDLDIIVLE